MRRSNLRHLAVILVLAGCVTGGGSSSTRPFQGQAAVEARIKQLNDQSQVSAACQRQADKSDRGGYIEVTASAVGKLVVRPLFWRGSPSTLNCIVDAAKKATVPPLPGPPVSTYWEFRLPGEPPLPAPDINKVSTRELKTVREHMLLDVQACALRFLPPEFPADIEVAFYVMPGGKPAVPNVIMSTSNDGGFDTCVLELVGGQTFPDPHYEGPFPLALKFHVGRAAKL